MHTKAENILFIHKIKKHERSMKTRKQKKANKASNNFRTNRERKKKI